MPMAMHSKIGTQIDASDFGLPSRPSIFDSPGGGNSSEDAGISSESSSSIGKNSDVSLDAGECGDNDEVQSSYKGPLDMMDALEEVLPFRKGISSFYDGKSRSYTSLADASTSSTVKEISKPENAYSRRRRNLLAFHQIWEKSHTSFLRGNPSGISKRPLSSSKSTLALAVAMCNSDSFSSSTSEDSSSGCGSRSPPLPPLHPHVRGCLVSPRKMVSSWKSYSVADLQHPRIRVRFDDSISEKSESEGEEVN